MTRTSTRIDSFVRAARRCPPGGPAGAWPAPRETSRPPRRATACRRRRPETARRACRAAPVKAPRSWPKSSASRSVSGNAAQLTATNGLPRTGPTLVERPRDQLLARAALPANENRRVAGRDGVHPVHSLEHLRRAADDRLVGVVLGELRPRVVELLHEGPVLGDAADPSSDLVDVERLGQIVVRPLLDRGTASCTAANAVIRMTVVSATPGASAGTASAHRSRGGGCRRS